MFPDGPEVELLDTRPPRPGRLRRQVLGGLAVVAAVGALVIGRATQGGSSHPSHPSSPPLVTSSPAAASSVPQPGVVISPDVAFARMGDTLYAVDAGRLITIDVNTGVRNDYPSTAITPGDRYTVLADGPAHRLWLVSTTEQRTTAQFLDPTTLAVTGWHAVRGTLIGAAALGGRLYLATPNGVAVVSPSPGPVPAAPRVPGQPFSLAADPSRHRLLGTFTGQQLMRIVAWTVGRSRPDVAGTAPIGKGDVVVAGGRIWTAGFGRHGVLAQLDPRSLRVIRHSPLEQEIGVGAMVVDSADRHLLVRSGAGAQLDLWCVDARTGAVVRHWSPANGTAVLTDRGVVLLAPDQPLIRLASGGCRG